MYRAQLLGSQTHTMQLRGRVEQVVDVVVINRDAHPYSGMEMTRRYTLTYSLANGALLAMNVTPADDSVAQRFGFPRNTFKHRRDSSTVLWRTQ